MAKESTVVDGAWDEGRHEEQSIVLFESSDGDV